MTEWLKVAVLKTDAANPRRGFESYQLRHNFGLIYLWERAMTVHELNAPVEAVDAAVMALVQTHVDKAQQARERSHLRRWFVGQTMKQLNGAADRQAVEIAVNKALQ